MGLFNKLLEKYGRLLIENEEDLFKAMNNFRLCIVHSLTEDYVLIDYNEYNSLIQNKRIQYQVNFKSK
jgi:uncharacterized protein YrrD